MAVLERRRAAKCIFTSFQYATPRFGRHKQITATVREIQPSEALSDGQVFIFPYTQVRTLTKEYLDKRKRSQIEKDKVLIELINNHPRKDVAFASCADALSELVVQELLNTIFDVDPVTLHGLEAYLQAFIAAAHSKDTLFLSGDRTFATVVIPVARDVINYAITPTTAAVLFSAWSNGTPSDRFLLSRVKLMTKRVCQVVATDLTPHDDPAWWRTARDYKQALSLLKRPSADLEDCLQTTFKTWRAWSNWNPNIARLQAWALELPSNALKFLHELEHPAFRHGCSTYGSECQALVRRHELLKWLESKGFSLGPGLLTDDREEALSGFAERLLDTAAHASRMGNSYAAFLKMLIDTETLDWQPLKHWQDAVLVLSSNFVNILVNNLKEEGNDNTLIEGLRTLSKDNAGSIRTSLSKKVCDWATRAAGNARTSFLARFASGQDWASQAERLWGLRNALARSDWLQPHLEHHLVKASRSQASKPALLRLVELQAAVWDVSDLQESHLQASIQVYVLQFVAEAAVSVDETTMIPKVLHTLWLCTYRDEVRKAGIVIASFSEFDQADIILCIKGLLNLSKDLVQGLHAGLLKLAAGHHSDFMSLTKTIAVIAKTSDSDSSCWRNLLRWSMESCGFHLHDMGFTSHGFTAYSIWVAHLYEVFTTSWDGLCDTHHLLSELARFNSVIQQLERRSEPGRAMSSLLTATNPQAQHNFRIILEYLQEELQPMRFEMLCLIALKADFAFDQAESLSVTVCAMSELDDREFWFCQELWTMHFDDKEVAQARLQIWLRMSSMRPTTANALRSLARTLCIPTYEGRDQSTSIPIYEARDQPTAPLEAVNKYYASWVAELVSRTQQLEASRAVLRKSNPDALRAVIEELGIEERTGAAQMIDELPEEMVDVVEETGDDVIDLHFSLSQPTLSAMERIAFGIIGTDSLVVHLRINWAGAIDAFCVHLEGGENSSREATHNFLELSALPMVPDRLQCQGLPTRLTYMIARSLWRQLSSGERSLKEVYEGIRHSMHTAPSQCLVCTKDFAIGLHRPSVCDSVACGLGYRRSHLDVRLEDIRTNSRVVDMLLTSVFSAATGGVLDLLPNRPESYGDALKLVELLDALPATSSLGSAAAIDQNHRNKGAEELLSWICNSYRGFIIPAGDRYRIPNLPNLHQFLLVDGPSEIEAAFAQHNDKTPRNILFHGTSIDRLYAVLCQGLRVLSGTPLQKHGAVHGPGIYFAREPSIAMSYALTSAVDSSAPFFKTRGDFNNATVLLGCEHAGNDDNATRPSGIHVVTDPSRVMVRFIWICPPKTRITARAQDLSIPMMSTFNDLRSSAARRTR